MYLYITRAVGNIHSPYIILVSSCIFYNLQSLLLLLVGLVVIDTVATQLAQVSAQCTVVNFIVTPEGLEVGRPERVCV